MTISGWGERTALWRDAVIAAARHELRLLAFAPLTTVFLAGFLSALALLVFLVGDFLATDVASFALQWTFLPWVALVMAPALAMRAFAEGSSERSLELVLSLPTPPAAVVIGKWLAGAALLAGALALTAPFAATLAYLGSPDWGAALAGYLGALLLLAAVYAVALAAAALTRDPVSAFVAAIAALFALLLPALDLGAGGAALAALSPKYWFDRMSEGRIELAGLVYFAALIGAALAVASAALARRRREGLPRDQGAALRLVGGLALAFALAHLAARSSAALDLTEEGEFTPHAETAQLLQALPEPVEIDFFYSADEAAIPAEIRRHARRAENLLRALEARAGGKLTLTVHRPEADGEVEDAALARGVRRVPMTSGDSFLLGAALRRGQRRYSLGYLDPRRAASLEYDLAVAINGLGRESPLRVGVLSPLTKPSNATEPREGLAVIEQLKRQYDLAFIPHFADAPPEGLDALLVIDAAVLKRDMLRAVDSHVMAGRGLVALVDPYPRFNPPNAPLSPAPSDEIDDITDLLARYGAVYVPEVVGDPDQAAPVSTGDGEPLRYPYWLAASASALSASHAVSAGLENLLFAEAGAFRIDPAASAAVALVSTGPRSGAEEDRTVFRKTAPEALATRFRSDGEGPRAVAVALPAPAQSAFADEGDPPSNPAPGSGARIFAVADADWIFDPMALSGVAPGAEAYARPLNDNLALLFNMIEAAAGDPRLIGVRSRGRVRRPFTRIADMLQASARRHQVEEQQRAARIARAEGAINTILSESGARSLADLPDALRGRIEALRAEMLPIRRELRQIRLGMRQEVETLGTRLFALNLMAGPLLAVALSAGLARLRRRAHARAGQRNR